MRSTRERRSRLTNDPNPPAQPARILVVDDEPGIRNVVRRMLQRAGHQVAVAAHGAEGLATFVAEPAGFDLVLTDLSMPEMDGPTMALAIRKLAPQVRILASSGMLTPEEEARARAAGIVGFVPKPYTAEGLLAVVQRALAGPTGGE